jgi:hypothetical protein
VGAYVHSFSIVIVNGHRELVAERFLGDDLYQGWRMNGVVKVLNTVRADNRSGKVTRSSGLVYESDLKAVLETILEKSANAKIKGN